MSALSTAKEGMLRKSHQGNSAKLNPRYFVSQGFHVMYFESVSMKTRHGRFDLRNVKMLRPASNLRDALEFVLQEDKKEKAIVVSFMEQPAEKKAWLTLWTSAVAGENVDPAFKEYRDEALAEKFNADYAEAAPLVSSVLKKQNSILTPRSKSGTALAAEEVGGVASQRRHSARGARAWQLWRQGLGLQLGLGWADVVAGPPGWPVRPAPIRHRSHRPRRPTGPPGSRRVSARRRATRTRARTHAGQGGLKGGARHVAAAALVRRRAAGVERRRAAALRGAAERAAAQRDRRRGHVPDHGARGRAAGREAQGDDAVGRQGAAARAPLGGVPPPLPLTVMCPPSPLPSRCCCACPRGRGRAPSSTSRCQRARAPRRSPSSTPTRSRSPPRRSRWFCPTPLAPHPKQLSGIDSLARSSASLPRQRGVPPSTYSFSPPCHLRSPPFQLLAPPFTSSHPFPPPVALVRRASAASRCARARSRRARRPSRSRPSRPSARPRRRRPSRWRCPPARLAAWSCPSQTLALWCGDRPLTAVCPLPPTPTPSPGPRRTT